VTSDRHVTGVNFTAAGALSISGRVTLDANGLFGVTVSTGTQNGSSDPNGDYVIEHIPPGSYKVIPSRTGYIFDPNAPFLTLTDANAVQNFTATKQ